MSDSTPTRCCKQCGITFPATTEFFYADKTGKYGVQTTCKTCQRETHRKNAQIRRKNPDYVAKERERGKEYYARPEVKKQQAEYSKEYNQREDVRARRKIARKTEKYREQNRLQGLRFRKTERYREWITERLSDPEFAAHKLEIMRRHAKSERYKLTRKAYLSRPETPQRRNEQLRARYIQSPEYRQMALNQNHKRRARKRQLPDTFSQADYDRMLEYWGNACALSGETENLHIDHWIPLRSSDCPGTVAENMIPLSAYLNASKNGREPQEWLVWKYGEVVATEHLEKIEAYFRWVKEQRNG